MFPLVEQWLSSGESQSAFCARHGIKVGVLSYWLKQYRSQKLSSLEGDGFSRLRVGSAEASDLEVCYPNGVRIRLGSSVSASFVLQLVGQC